MTFKQRNCFLLKKKKKFSHMMDNTLWSPVVILFGHSPHSPLQWSVRGTFSCFHMF